MVALVLCTTFMGVSIAGPPTDPGRGLRLPLVTQQLRESIAEGEIQTILAATQAASLTAAEAHDVVWNATAAARAYPEVGALGPVVAGLLAEGVRGEELGVALFAHCQTAVEGRRTVGRRAP